MRRALLAPALFLIIVRCILAADWPEFRGPTGQGHYAGKPLPVEWSTTKNVAWKQPIPGKGWSSPVVWRGRIYLTSGVPVEGSKDLSLQALCLDAESGKLLWQTEVFRPESAKSPRIHQKNSPASPTPLTDGKRLYVHFGHQGTAALDLDGKVLWRNTDLGYAPVHGNGGSPILVGERLIFSGDGSDKQFIVALDPATGKVTWKTDRNSTAAKRFSFSTPLAVAVNGTTQIVSPASDAVIAYDAADGKELWRVKYDGYSVVPRPVSGHGMVFLSSGYDRPSLLGVKVDGKGDVTVSHLAWKAAKGAPHNPSALLVGDELYMVSDLGIVSCLDARSGKVHWQERLNGNFSASPLFADGKVYLQSEEGVATVLRAGKKFEKLATNAMDERTLASLAAVDGVIYLRTEGHLYRIEKR